jgi:hypothetical protein
MKERVYSLIRIRFKSLLRETKFLPRVAKHWPNAYVSMRQNVRSQPKVTAWQIGLNDRFGLQFPVIEVTLLIWPG